MRQNSFISRALDYFFKSNNHPSHAVGHTHTDDQKNTNCKPEASSEEQNSAEKSGPSDSNKSLFTPANVMRAIGVEIFDDGGDGYYLVGFQGGAFVFYFEDDRLNVMYNDIVECTYADSVKAAFVANDINSEYAVWSCYLRTSKRGTTEKPVKVCFSQMFSLKGNFKETMEFIHGIMSSSFTVGREFKIKFNEALKDGSNLANILNRKDFLHKLELAKRLSEVSNLDKITVEKPLDSYLRVNTLATFFDDTEFGEPEMLRVIDGEKVEIVNGQQNVTEFDIRNYIRNHPENTNLDTLTVLVTFEKQDLIINLKKMEGSAPKSLFFMLNVMRSGLEADVFSRNHSTVSFRTTVEIRLTSEVDDYWEVKYMVDEAREKQSNNQVSTLTDEQKMMLIQLSPNVQDDLYWGIKFFNEDCWYQSLYYFKRIFYNYCRPEYVEENKEDIIADICLYIGITYYQLKMYDRAYYYLDRSRKYDSIVASEWFVNCLCRMKDPMAFTYIKQMLEIVSSNIQQTVGKLEPEVENEFYTYYLFLKRKLVQSLVFENRLTEAEHFLKQMIENKENMAFSKEELETIRRIKQSNVAESQEERSKTAENDELNNETENKI